MINAQVTLLLRHFVGERLRLGLLSYDLSDVMAYSSFEVSITGTKNLGLV